ncbi:hypothetical protein PR048_006737 [Dryococelus australis]|uniref:Uncharacterized protein n=1 Tax=Dryococelus australis TaxID=614101 RepID=A0ABQ9ICE5_9NEOP|nr:hypothetical protein PR048_006737 [Dryococelus australis]
MQVWRKRGIPEKTRMPVASSDVSTACGNPRATAEAVIAVDELRRTPKRVLAGFSEGWVKGGRGRSLRGSATGRNPTETEGFPEQKKKRNGRRGKKLGGGGWSLRLSSVVIPRPSPPRVDKGERPACISTVGQPTNSVLRLGEAKAREVRPTSSTWMALVAQHGPWQTFRVRPAEGDACVSVYEGGGGGRGRLLAGLGARLVSRLPGCMDRPKSSAVIFSVHCLPLPGPDIVLKYEHSHCDPPYPLATDKQRSPQLFFLLLSMV